VEQQALAAAVLALQSHRHWSAGSGSALLGSTKSNINDKEAACYCRS
jgi:hypothetical protein